MATSQLTDPFQFWRDAVTKMEGEINTFVTNSLKNPEVAGQMQKAASVSNSLQQAVERLIENYLQRINIPSRKQVDELAKSLERIEAKLDELLPRREIGVRPARTRKPAAPVAVEAAPAVVLEAAAPVRAKRRAAVKTRS